MGEYILLNGQETKIGTCESLYYVTFEMLQGWIALGITRQAGGNEPPSEYAKPDSGFRFRFPFPDEDGKDLLSIGDFDRGYTLSAPAGFMDEVDHIEKWHPVHPIGQQHGGYHFNVSYPCPSSKAFTQQTVVKRSHGERPTVIQIVSQKYVQAETTHGQARLWTCARCAYCGATFRMNPETAIKLVDHEISVYGEIRHTELFRRMLAGYNEPAE